MKVETTMTPIDEKRVTLRDVSWDFYQAMRREIGDGNIHLTFDQARLEIVSPSAFHEKNKKDVARLTEAYADHMGVDIEGYGSTTLDRVDLQKGVEPDECYYIGNADAVLGRDDLDLCIDPPPDLAIEIDISPPGVDKQPIYAAMGVPEIWYYDGRRLLCLQRKIEGDSGPQYVPSDRSLAFPKLDLAEFRRLLNVAQAKGQSAAVRELRQKLSR